MALVYESTAKIVAVIETVVTYLVLGIIAVFVGFIGASIPDTPDGTDRKSNVKFIITISVGLAIFCGINLGVLITLWKAVQNKSFVKSTIWYITQCVFTSLEIFSFLIGLMYIVHHWYAYIIIIVKIGYKIWAIHVIKSFGDGILSHAGFMDNYNSYSNKKIIEMMV